MLEVQGFHGLRFDPQKTGTLDHVITPPYDVISPEERAALAAQGQYNMVHLILPEEGEGISRYEAAARLLEAWLAEGVIRQDAEPYLLRQRYTDLYGAMQTRCGFFGLLRLPEEGERFILGHERTFDKPVEDRLRLTQATRANLEPIFSLYADQTGELEWFYHPIKERKPDMTANTVDGVRQELWRVPHDPRISEFLQDQTLYIADGHHRFRTALIYRDRMRAAAKTQTQGTQPWDFVLTGFVSLHDSGLKIYPAHRVVEQLDSFDPDTLLRTLKRYFEVVPVEGNLAVQVRRSRARCAIGVCIAGRGDFVLRLRENDRVELLGDDHGPAWRDLDVAVLHRGILERILKIPEGAEFRYETDAARAMAMPREGRAVLAFILRATRPDQICACAEAGEAMPQKSTYFFPKLPSGAVIYRLA